MELTPHLQFFSLFQLQCLEELGQDYASRYQEPRTRTNAVELEPQFRWGFMQGEWWTLTPPGKKLELTPEKKPQREPSYRCHVDPHTIGRRGHPSSSQSRVGYCSIGWGQSSNQVLMVWDVEMGKLLRVFLLLASGGACLFGRFERNSLPECRISIVWMLKHLWAIWLPHRGLDNY